MVKSQSYRTSPSQRVWPSYHQRSPGRGKGTERALARLVEAAGLLPVLAPDTVHRQQARRAMMINTKRRLQVLREHDAKANLEAIRAANALRQPKGRARREPQGGSTGITINRVRNWLKRHGR